MKTANLITAILFTALLTYLFLDAFNYSDADTMLGAIIFAPPTILNWISWYNWPKKETK